MAQAFFELAPYFEIGCGMRRQAKKSRISALGVTMLVSMVPS